MARVKIFPSLAMPANIAYVPNQLFYAGPPATFIASLPVLFTPWEGMWMIIWFVMLATWMGYWAIQYRKNPHVWSIIKAKYTCGCFRFQRTRNIRPEKGNKFDA